MKSNSDAGSGKERQAQSGASAFPGPPNLSRPFEIAGLPDGGLDVSISADAAERAAIAKENGLIAVQSLEADVHVARENTVKFKVTGVVRARVAQTCVVSLDPFESEIEADIDADFAVPPQAPRVHGARRNDPEAESRQFMAPSNDDADPIVGGRIDLGALTEEFFVLNLDPHPRKPGARFDDAEFSDAPETPSAFAVLKKLKDGD